MKTPKKTTTRKHKLKRSREDKISKMLKQIARLDHSVSVPTWGTLFRYEPKSPLGKAQANVADIYGVPFVYPSTNGTTILNVMALLCASNPGDTVLVQRDSHVSVLAPIIHAGLRPVYVTPRFSEKLGVTMGVTVSELGQELDQNPEIKVVFLTYPNYFGIATDIAALAEVTMQRGLPLIVDSAHGSHWAFHSSFPIRAEQAGAQIVTYSNHKTCPTLGQGSLALFNDEKFIPRLYEVVNNLGFVSTSFSSIILTSLFNGIDLLNSEGETLLGERLEMAEWARNQINEINGLHSFGLEEAQPGFLGFDPLRLTVDVSEIGYTGYQIEDILIKKHGYYPEMGTLQNVLFLITAGIGWKEIRQLMEFLREIARNPRSKKRLPDMTRPGLPCQILLPRDAFYFRNRRTMRVEEAAGCISGETISAYPPGSAIIVAGEQITPEIVNYLKAVQRFGGVLKGASDSSFRTIQILDMH
jgi:arginine/lysine/ornithine decarboxylase